MPRETSNFAWTQTLPALGSLSKFQVPSLCNTLNQPDPLGAPKARSNYNIRSFCTRHWILDRWLDSILGSLPLSNTYTSRDKTDQSQEAPVTLFTQYTALLVVDVASFNCIRVQSFLRSRVALRVQFLEKEGTCLPHAPLQSPQRAIVVSTYSSKNSFPLSLPQARSTLFS